jgi:hypothetical protein
VIFDPSFRKPYSKLTLKRNHFFRSSCAFQNLGRNREGAMAGKKRGLAALLRHTNNNIVSCVVFKGIATDEDCYQVVSPRHISHVALWLMWEIDQMLGGLRVALCRGCSPLTASSSSLCPLLFIVFVSNGRAVSCVRKRDNSAGCRA